MFDCTLLFGVNGGWLKMAKVEGPLFSLVARGSVNNLLTFQTTKAGQIVKGYKAPKDKKTEKQVQNRTNFKEARLKYKDLGADDRSAWRFRAYGELYTGYAAFIKYCKKAIDLGKTWITIKNVDVIDITGMSAKVVMNVSSAAGVKVLYGEKPGAYYNQVSETEPYSLNPQISLSGLTAKTKYYFRVDLITENGNRGETGDYVFQTV
jgi:hypothetical protein